MRTIRVAMPKPRAAYRGNCYVACEALYHLLGGKAAGITSRVVRLPWGGTHWFLTVNGGRVIDVTLSQFTDEQVRQIPWNSARGCGFLTAKPSRRARELMRRLVWQELKAVRKQGSTRDEK